MLWAAKRRVTFSVHRNNSWHRPSERTSITFRQVFEIAQAGYLAKQYFESHRRATALNLRLPAYSSVQKKKSGAFLLLASFSFLFSHGAASYNLDGRQKLHHHACTAA
jgi:hypothetical protein